MYRQIQSSKYKGSDMSETLTMSTNARIVYKYTFIRKFRKKISFSKARFGIHERLWDTVYRRYAKCSQASLISVDSLIYDRHISLYVQLRAMQHPCSTKLCHEYRFRYVLDYSYSITTAKISDLVYTMPHGFSRSLKIFSAFYNFFNNYSL